MSLVEKKKKKRCPIKHCLKCLINVKEGIHSVKKAFRFSLRAVEDMVNSISAGQSWCPNYLTIYKEITTITNNNNWYNKNDSNNNDDNNYKDKNKTIYKKHVKDKFLNKPSYES